MYKNMKKYMAIEYLDDGTINDTSGIVVVAGPHKVEDVPKLDPQLKQFADLAPEYILCEIRPVASVVEQRKVLIEHISEK